MMFFLLFGIVFIFSYGSAEDLKDLNPFELLKLGQDVSNILRPLDPQSSDVTFYLVTRSQPQPVLITSGNKDLIDTAKKTKFIIHGWIENHRRSWYKFIGDEYLKLYDLNFIQVDWEKPARYPYLSAAKAVEFVGNEIAKFIQNTNLPLKDVHLIGHSLGSHVAGFAGKKLIEATGDKLNRISALDPAGPAFRKEPNERLDKKDAEIVDAIHTDAGFYGYENPIGTLDIYVNGGQRVQPGCIDTEAFSLSLGGIASNSFCSHARSHQYFGEWINIGKFKCKFCNTALGVNFLGDKCIRHTDLTIGAEDVYKNVTGTCFANTNDKEPYLS